MAQGKKSATKVSYIVIFTGVFIGIFLLVYIFVGRPVLKYSDALKAEFQQKQAQLQESQELVRTLPDPRKAMDEIKLKLLELQDSGSSKKQLPRLMQLLGATAGERNVTVVSLRPRDDIKSPAGELPEGINKVYLEIVVICNYQALAEYIKAVGGLPPAFNVESLSVEKQSETLAPLEAKSASRGQGSATGLLKATVVFSAISG